MKSRRTRQSTKKFATHLVVEVDSEPTHLLSRSFGTLDSHGSEGNEPSEQRENREGMDLLDSFFALISRVSGF